MMQTLMGIAAKNLAASDDESLLGARLRAECGHAGVQAPNEGDRPAATRASASNARSGQCPDPLLPITSVRSLGEKDKYSVRRLSAALHHHRQSTSAFWRENLTIGEQKVS
jgi:hypothetical protein